MEMSLALMSGCCHEQEDVSSYSHLIFIHLASEHYSYVTSIHFLGQVNVSSRYYIFEYIHSQLLSRISWFLLDINTHYQIKGALQWWYFTFIKLGETGHNRISRLFGSGAKNTGSLIIHNAISVVFAYALFPSHGMDGRDGKDFYSEQNSGTTLHQCVILYCKPTFHNKRKKSVTCNTASSVTFYIHVKQLFINNGITFSVPVIGRMISSSARQSSSSQTLRCLPNLQIIFSCFSSGLSLLPTAALKSPGCGSYT